MTWADSINGFYELLGGLLILNHCRAVVRDKAVAGVSIVSTALFTTWECGTSTTTPTWISGRASLAA